MTDAIQKAIENTDNYTREPSSALLKLRDLSAVRRLDEMKSNLENERYILGRMALAGQITLFYSRAGSGKTLLFMRFIIDAINDGVVNADDVIYINADDNYKGLLTKAEIAEQYGFEMISPDEASVTKDVVLDLLDELVSTGEITGKVIIIDTLKKFADMMSKGEIKALLNRMRRITAKAGTVIIAGHANKNASIDGKLVYEGTSDTINDVDCVYSINLTSEPEGDVTVDIVREKCRGDNVYQATYTYKKLAGLTYLQMIDSVKKAEAGGSDTSFRPDIQSKLEDYESEILFVKSIFEDMDEPNESVIISCYKHNKNEGIAAEISERKLRRALKELDGIVWGTTRDLKNNAKKYQLKNKPTAYLVK